jgi:hypothetical protein
VRTRELIAALQNADPSGEAEVVAGSTPIYFVTKEPAYWDGPLHVLIHDEAKRGNSYSIIGYAITNRGEKVRLNLMGLDDCLCDNADLPVDLTGLSGDRLQRAQERVAELRAESRAADAAIAATPPSASSTLEGIE